jgi:hypothetical protein
LNTLGRVSTALSVPVRTDVSDEVLNLHPVIGVTEYCMGDSKEALVDRAKTALDMARKTGGVYLSDGNGATGD